jgi:transcriptional regulator with XRE-family HTH domain
MKCPNCKSESFSPMSAPIELRFKAAIIQAPARGSRCAECGEILLPDAELEAAEEYAARWLVGSGAAGGDVFRFLRKRLGCSAKDVAALFGVSYDTVLRWEKGERDVPRPEMALMASLVEDAMNGREGVRDLLERMGEPSLREPRDLKVIPKRYSFMGHKVVFQRALHKMPSPDVLQGAIDLLLQAAELAVEPVAANVGNVVAEGVEGEQLTLRR